MDVWHDATQVFGPEHPLWIAHSGETAADQVVEEWVDAIQRAPLPRPLDAFAFKANVDRDGPESVRRRNERLVAGHHDLRLVFAARAGKSLPLADLACDRGLPMWQHTQQAKGRHPYGIGSQCEAGASPLTLRA